MAKREKILHGGPSQRQLRVGERIKHILGEALGRGLMDDEGLERVALTLTEVQPSADLRHARVFFVPFQGTSSAEAQEALEAVRPALNRLLGRQLQTKFTPKLSFHHDGSFDRADRLDRLIRGLDTDGMA